MKRSPLFVFLCGLAPLFLFLCLSSPAIRGEAAPPAAAEEKQQHISFYQRSPGERKKFAEAIRGLQRGGKPSFADVVLQATRGRTAGAAAAAASAASAAAKNRASKQQQHQKPHCKTNLSLPKVQQQVVDTLKVNRAAKASDKKQAATHNADKHHLDDILQSLLRIVEEEASGIYLYHVRDPITGITVVEACKVNITGFLGAGGTAVVMKASVVDEGIAAVLGFDEVAIKMQYYTFGKPVEITKRLKTLILQDMQEMIQSEIKPLKQAAAAAQGAAASGRGGSKATTARKIVEENRWVLPVYIAEMVDPEETLLLHKETLFFNTVLITKVMAGDGADLLHNSPYGNTVDRLPVEASVFVCAQVIETVAKLHANGLCHADVKPENFLIGKDGTIHLADFGMVGGIGERRKCSEKITLLFMDPTHARCWLRGGWMCLSDKYDAWSVGLTCYVIISGGRLPYNIPNGEGLQEYLSLIDKTQSSRSLALQSPAQELLDMGVPGPWAETIADLLDRDRSHRKTPLNLTGEFSSWPPETANLRGKTRSA
ncbi:Rhoptry kinase family protein ROP30, putative [Eimeria acervulina]|uniref:Rhoptry kinase family protein ROP30, putative n=1 Tax=Eimeria acervulina TaxID=5801 RepID=U6GQQ7_EIMAC|nr:Rhoptry kinase family protein ROP30, putative [Eimeria acervulina]CDI81583.1 Rhoptry kinase family protein ROP30, putative [Eimeria acervulina]